MDGARKRNKYPVIVRDFHINSPVLDRPTRWKIKSTGDDLFDIYRCFYLHLQNTYSFQVDIEYSPR